MKTLLALMYFNATECIFSNSFLSMDRPEFFNMILKQDNPSKMQSKCDSEFGVESFNIFRMEFKMSMVQDEI